MKQNSPPPYFVVANILTEILTQQHITSYVLPKLPHILITEQKSENENTLQELIILITTLLLTYSEHTMGNFYMDLKEFSNNTVAIAEDSIKLISKYIYFKIKPTSANTATVENPLLSLLNKYPTISSSHLLKENIKKQDRFLLIKLPLLLTWKKLLTPYLENSESVLKNTHEENINSLILINNHIYLAKARKLEIQLAQHIKKKIATNTFKVITGGPGTGKTTNIFNFLKDYLLSFLQQNNITETSSLSNNTAALLIPPFLPRITLSAYTGKAVARLKSSLQNSLKNYKETFLQIGALSNWEHVVLTHIGNSISNAKTLHRLLQVGKEQILKIKQPRNELISWDVIVIDETSMMPHENLLTLLTSSAPNCYILLVGDPFQLPSINSGNLLNDIAGPTIKAQLQNNKEHPFIKNKNFLHLTGASYRYSNTSSLGQAARYIEDISNSLAAPSAQLFKNAIDENIINNKIKKNLFLLNDTPIKNTTELVKDKKDSTTINKKFSNTLSNEAAEIIEKEFLPHFIKTFTLAKGKSDKEKAHNLLKNFCSRIILTATNSGENSALAIMQYLQKKLTDLGFKLPNSNYIPVGSLFMIIVNDYDHNVWNGDIAIALEDSKGVLRLYFHSDNNPQVDENGILLKGNEKYWQSRMAPLYATTIHKSQGDEFDEVFALFPPTDYYKSMLNPNFLSRELLYTALTRAKKKIWLYLEDEVLSGILQCSSNKKNSGLQEALWKI